MMMMITVDAIGTLRGVVRLSGLRTVIRIVVRVLFSSDLMGETTLFASDAVASSISEEMTGRANCVEVMRIRALVPVETISFQEPLAWSRTISTSIICRSLVLSDLNAESFPILVLSALSRRASVFEVTSVFLMASSS